MSSLEELNAEIAALKQKIAANEAKVDAGTLSEAREVAIRQQISTDTNRLRDLEARREVRLQQQQQLLLAGQEQARKELATYLHDGLQSSLVVIGLQMKRVLKETSVPGQEILRSLIAEVEQLRSSDVRSAMNELSPDLEGVSILASLDVLARKYAGAMQVEFDFDVTSSDSGLGSGHKLAIYRIVEQALLNAARHGETKSCLVSASISDQMLALVVSGPGLPVATSYKAGVGLSVIDGWCKVYGGSWKLASNEGSTALAVTLKI